jgi:hypothetical protein
LARILFNSVAQHLSRAVPPLQMRFARLQRRARHVTRHFLRWQSPPPLLTSSLLLTRRQ